MVIRFVIGPCSKPITAPCSSAPQSCDAATMCTSSPKATIPRCSRWSGTTVRRSWYSRRRSSVSPSGAAEYRFGPLVEPPPGARRSLAEQIRGTGQFALRHGAGDALHAACARALQEAAKRRIAGYLHLSAGERLSALARVTGFDRHALAAALHHAGSRRSHELRNTIALMEAARRQVMHDPKRSPHATL